MTSLRSFHRFSRTASLALSLAIVLSGLLQPALSKTSERNVLSRTKTAQRQTENGKAKKVSPLPPEPGPPSGITLPDLEQLRHKRHEEPQAPAPIESTIRSRRKSVRPPQRKKSHHAVSRPMATRNSIYAAAPLEPQSGQPTFTDDPLKDPNNPESFKIKALHITELRTWINALRVQRGLSNYVWQKPTGSGGAINNTVLISWEPIDEMRTALNEAVGPPANGYAPGLALNQLILAAHIQELRDRVKAEWGGSSLADQLVPARIDLFNQSGNQIEARDCEWGISLISLPGRAGLDLGIGLTYSSMVWSRAGSYISFDDDKGDPSPGFKIGFPAIQGRYTDNQVGANVYLLITSAGRRVELRRVGASNVYEAGDSSYLQLIDLGGSLLMKTTDGVQMSYAFSGGEWHCVLVQDRNGNQINATYNGGDIATVTDTLGRVLYFNYDSNANLNSITQHFDGLWHTWASFGWGTKTLHPNFGLSIVGAYDGEMIPVLTQVGLEDGSHYNFEYNNYGQVNVIRRYTADGPAGSEGDIQRAYTTYDYDTATPDCPRINAAHVWAESWSDVGDLPHEVITYFNDNGDGSHQMTAPDGTVYKEFYGTGWQHGLVTSSQLLTGSTVQKTTYTSWAQDNTSVGYQINPRVIETNVYDANNHRRTTIDYSMAAYAQYGLPYFVSEYAANGTTEIRRSYTDYNLSQAYLDHRIIGLVSAQRVMDVQTGQWVAKTTYEYDQTAINPQASDAIMHDAYNYPASMTVRGNVTAVSRWDVNNINTAATTASMTYDAAGSLLTSTDPANHATHFSYADSFSNDGTNSYTPQDVNGNPIITFAYPTSVTDADGYSTTVKYNFDFGAKTRAQNPLGAVQTFTYDNAERLHQATMVNTGAFMRHEYGSNYTSHYRNINNLNSDDTFTTEVFDGGGRVIAIESTNPGSAGGYKAQWIEYDVMGRVSRQSNPTEIFWDWTPYGDDAAGRIYTRQTYDWKGRPLQTTNQDGTIKYASYAGCGCAGGEVVTLTDEVGRQQKVYSDTLGRQWKTEVLNWDGSVYATTTSTLNARDQVTLARQYQGTDSSNVYQDTTMSYDGYGRLQSKHVPEQQDSNGNPTYSTWVYKPDDAIESVTDARGAVATYTYNNNRHLVNEIHYSAPSGITPTSNVTFGYDAAGNRTSMTDGLGTKSYSYNSLSQLMSETRTITNVGTFALNYDYNLAGELKKITDATGMTVNYAYDNVGRVTGVTGSDNLYAGVSNYASNFQYRAWGGLKAMTDGTSHISSLTYNSKLRPSQFDISSYIVHQNYDYYDDGRISFVHNPTDAKFDRSYTYDHVGRVMTAFTGGAARQDTGDVPYYENFGYDAFSNSTSRFTETWVDQDYSDAATYSNNRRNGWGYDPDGRIATINNRHYNYDAAGNQSALNGQIWTGSSYVATTIASGVDGDGNKVQEVSTYPSTVTTYYLRSTVLRGAIVEELSGAGQKQTGYVYTPSGELLARQAGFVVWKHPTPTGTGEYEIYPDGFVHRIEFDPVGADVGLTAPLPPDTHGDLGDIGSSHNGGSMDSRYGDLANPGAGCVNSNGQEFPCGLFDHGSLAVFDIEQISDPYAFKKARPRAPLPPKRLPFNDPLDPYRPFDPDIEQSIHLDPLFSSLNIVYQPQNSSQRNIAGAGPRSINDTVPGVCSLQVDFGGPGFRQTNGPGVSPLSLQSDKPNWGLGFTVSGSVTEGGIGVFEVPDPPGSTIVKQEVVNPHGNWTVQQWIRRYGSRGYDDASLNSSFSDSVARPDGPSEDYRNVDGDAFVYADHPGPLMVGNGIVGGAFHDGNLIRYDGHWDFDMKLIRGTQACEVRFHIDMQLRNGHFQAFWRKGP